MFETLLRLVLLGTTVGVYVAVAVAVILALLVSVPRIAVSLTVTGVAVPVNVASGLKVTTPVVGSLCMFLHLQL